MTRRVGSDAEPSTPIAFALSTALSDGALRTTLNTGALSTALSARSHPPVSAVLSADGPPTRAELSTEWYVPTAGAWYEARAGRVPAPPAPITARVPAPPRAPPAPITARSALLEARMAGEVEEEADERQQRLQTSEVEGGAQHGASDRSDEDSSDGWETVSEDG
jgi:hypothetical protein